MPREIHLEWNRTSGEVTPSEGYRLKRNENVTFIVAPKTARVASTFATGWALVLTLKVKGNYDDTPLLAVTSWTDAGDGTYTKTVQVSSTEIDEALEADATLTDDLAEIDCVADLNLSISGGAPEKSDTIAVTLQNCVSNASDGTPTSTSVAITASGYTMGTGKLLGRGTAGTGAIELITVGSGLTLSGTTLTAAGGSITVGTTTITSGTTGRLLYDNAGVVGEAILGTGLRLSSGTLHAVTKSIKEYGAVGDGSTDDSAAFIAAIAALNAGTISRLYLPKGTYLDSTTHILYGWTSAANGYLGNITIEGDTGAIWKYTGSGTHIKIGGGGIITTLSYDGSTYTTVTTSDAHGLTASQGVTFHTAAGVTSSATVFDAPSATTFRVTGNVTSKTGVKSANIQWFTNFNNITFWHDGAVGSTICFRQFALSAHFHWRDVIVDGFHTGLITEDGNTFQLVDCRFEANTYGIRAGYQFSSCLLANNSFISNTEVGLELGYSDPNFRGFPGYCTGTTLVGNDFTLNKVGCILGGLSSVIEVLGGYAEQNTQSVFEIGHNGTLFADATQQESSIGVVSISRPYIVHTVGPAFRIHRECQSLRIEDTGVGSLQASNAAVKSYTAGGDASGVHLENIRNAITYEDSSAAQVTDLSYSTRAARRPIFGGFSDSYNNDSDSQTGGNTSNIIRRFDNSGTYSALLDFRGTLAATTSTWRIGLLAGDGTVLTLAEYAQSGNKLLQFNSSGALTIGVASDTKGSIVLHNASTANTVTLQSGFTSGSYTITLPTAAPAGNGYGLSFTSAGVASFAALFDPASPGAIGGTTAAAGTFTTLSGTTSVTTPTLTSSAGLTVSTTANNNLVLTPGGTGITTSSKRIDSSVAAGSVAFSFSTYAANTGIGVDSGYVTVFYNGHQAYQISDAYTVVKSPNGNPVTFQLICWGTNIASFYGHPSAASNLFIQNTTTALRTDTCNTFTSYTSFESFKVDWKTTANLCRTGTSKGSGGGSARNLQVETGDTIRAFYSAGDATLTESSATTFATVALAASTSVGMELVCTVYANDSTDFQSLTSRLIVDAVAKTTTITPTLTQVDGTTAASAGTLTCTYTVADAGANTFTIKANAASSLTQTTLKVRWAVVAVNSTGTPTITAA